MGISIILKVAGIGLLVSAALQVMPKQSRDEYSPYVILGGFLVVLLMLLPEIDELFDTVRDIFGF
ncbi:MAG: stage III sporulation protein AC [Clostridiales bacterium]|jgi:stage III sporulation protein AC|nr:stage III sporulation protein AC [Clostridiales bacterium]HOA84569.1 stage III sporulation AC/AD family protein [Bacillota bacterium]